MAAKVFKDLKEMLAYLRHNDAPSKLKEVEPKKKAAKKTSKKK